MPGRPPKTPEEFEIAKRLGANILAARKLAGLNGQELGEAVGRSKQAVSDWEVLGKGPEGFLIPKIAEALDVSPSWLFHGILQMPDRNGPEVVARRLVKRIGLERARALLSVSEADLKKWSDALIASQKKSDVAADGDVESDAQ